MDIVGQHDHLSLTRAAEVRELLDRSLDATGSKAASAYRRAWDALTDARAARSQLGGDRPALSRELDLVTFQSDEIAGAGLSPGDDEELETIAERLRERGYRTALIGKWHLGSGDSGPASQGFDVAIGGEGEAAPASFFDPFDLARLPDRKPGGYLTDRLTEEALAFLDASAGEPFFLVLSHYAVHTPIEAPLEMSA